MPETNRIGPRGARVEIRALAKRYATGETTVAALDGIDLTLEPGAWGAEIRSSCGGQFVFVDEAAEEVVPFDATGALLGRV